MLQVKLQNMSLMLFYYFDDIKNLRQNLEPRQHYKSGLETQFLDRRCQKLAIPTHNLDIHHSFIPPVFQYKNR
jgi:hypothetical protein